VHPGLDANPTNYLAFGGARLIAHNEIVLEECKVWENGEVRLTEMDEDCDLKNGIQVQMDKHNLEMIEPDHDGNHRQGDRIIAERRIWKLLVHWCWGSGCSHP
jgi:hypothetical protein